METIENISKKTNMKGFFAEVFDFSENGRNDMLNLLQYILLAILPIVLLNKSINRFIPETDVDKSSIELSFELFLQLIVLFFGLYFINRIILYIPTYSQIPYPDIYTLNSVLAIIVILFSFQTKAGEKLNILLDRIEKLWNGNIENNQKQHKPSNIKISQPLSIDKQQQNNTLNFNSPSQSMQNDNTTSLSNLPVQTYPNYDTMHADTTTPLIGANTPGNTNTGGSGNYQQNQNYNFNKESDNEIMPANSILGGSFGASF